MFAEPKPGVARSDTDSVATANGPREASMLDSVGFGPRWKGLACAEAAAGATVMASAVSAVRVAALPSRVREVRNDVVVIMTPFSDQPSLEGNEGALMVHV